MRIHAVDKTGENVLINESDMIEKYEMTDEAYDKREGSDLVSFVLVLWKIFSTDCFVFQIR